ncbi:hypothetical protein S7711_04661 [Stachybotrys chartarum IBT 7711]|uniref:FAS1 domain-containing protein n=1 Tax=Stachybotrys chartarum (strain CBS 109288 / IBT 7711) TaxID=1280523 RepID=A0A084B618_STACB|nr:hypothetical protein S7711_04661 [Stachybotrys chartarum IBT 7711]
MKLVAAALPVLASAFVLPPDQAPLSHVPQAGHEDAHHASWWEQVQHRKESLASAWDEALDTAQSGLEHAADAVEAQWNEVASSFNGGHQHEFPEQTIYQVISDSKYTTKFAKIVDHHPDVVKLLNSTDAGNYTLFVPLDSAFEHIPEHHKKPSDDFVEALLLYHVALGNYPAGRVLHSHTIPTALNESFLGGDAQRLRVRLGLRGVKLNFYSSLVATDFATKNGLVHAIGDILVPPPFAGREISLFPQYFSTLLLAWEKTDFGKFVHGVKTTGTTVFAPSNEAFSRLGTRANAFLFNTETGLKYLNAILKYHVTANATLYSDAYYDHTSDEDAVNSASGTHYELTTLLHDLHLGVDVGRVLGFLTLRVNGFSRVTVQDGIARNGVVHVVDKVLIPPHKHHSHEEEVFETDDISVEELKERLDEYVE